MITETTRPVEDAASQYRLLDPFNPSNLQWQQVSGSTSEDWIGYNVIWMPSTASGIMIIVGVGPAGSEVIKSVSRVTDRYQMNHEFVPIHIPAGSRVAVATLSWTSYEARYSVIGVKATGTSGFTSYTNVDCGPFNLDSGDAGYTSAYGITAPSANNTKGPWTEISRLGTNAAANNELNGNSLQYQYQYLGVQAWHNYFANSSLFYMSLDIGVGPAGEEEVAIGDISISYKPNVPNTSPGNNTLWFPWNYPAGTRVSARYQLDDISMGSIWSLLFYGVR